MLTSANVSVRMAVNYYECENYYLSGEALAPAIWGGRFAKELGLEGKLEQHNFEQLLRGFGPSGVPLISSPELPYPNPAKLTDEIQKNIVMNLRRLSNLNDLANHNRSHQNILIQEVTEKLKHGPLNAKFIKGFEKKWINVIEAQEHLEPSTETIKTQRTQLKDILALAAETNPRRAALDLTFSAPKSVSVQALVFGDSRLLQAHRQAVATTMQYIEDHFAHCRVGPKSARQTHSTAKLAYAQFEHDLSREKDPHLHTHNVMMNLTPALGKVRALHNDELFQNKRMLGTFYRNELALRVRSLGYNIELGKEGTFEISGFSREQIESFSQRHQQIWAQERSNQAEVYKHFYEKRKSKDKLVDRQELKIFWQKTALELGIQPINSTANQGLILGAKPSSLADEAKSLTEKSVALRRQDLQTQRLASNMGNITSQKIIEECNSYAQKYLVPTKFKDTFTTTDALRAEENYRKAVVNGIGKVLPLFPKDDTEKLETKLWQQNILTQQNKNKLLVDSKIVVKSLVSSPSVQTSICNELQHALRENQKLFPRQLYTLRTKIADLLKQDASSQREKKALFTTLRSILDPFEKHVQAMTTGQINAVIGTLKSCDKIIIWQGVAGAGKTFSLKKTTELMLEAGLCVKGFAPSSAATKQLATDTNLATSTIDSFLLSNVTGSSSYSSVLKKREFWIIDEAGMLSATQMEKLMAKATQENARVLLVGDTKQLAAVAAGNPFLDLQRNTKTTKLFLPESVRQKTPKLQLAVHQIYAGKMEDAAHSLHREIIEEPDLEMRCRRAADAYLNLGKKDQDQTLLLAKTNEERRKLTQHVRAGLKETGVLQNETTLNVLRVVDFTELERTQSQNLSKGMVVVPNKSISRKLAAGNAFAIEKIDLKKNEITVHDEQGSTRRIDCKSLKHATLYNQAPLQVAVGDKVVWSRNDRSTGMLNNDLFRVAKICDRGVTIESVESQESISGREKIKRILNPKTLHHLDHAWALTVHRAQGQTAKNVILIADHKLTTQEFLVGVTRAKENLLVVAQDKESVEKIEQREKEKEIAHEVKKTLSTELAF